MPFYALATLPLIKDLQHKRQPVRQTWLADDSAGAGKLRELRSWWDSLCDVGRLYGYLTNSDKTVLLVKEPLLEVATKLFEDTGVLVMTRGVRYLGSAVGDEDFLKAYLEEKVNRWMEEIDVLARFAQTEPHAAFAALGHGLRSKFAFLLRTLPPALEVLQKVDSQLEERYLPAVSGHADFTPDELSLLRLPARLGGTSWPCLAEAADFEHKASKGMTDAQVEEIVKQNAPHAVPSIGSVHKAAVQARNKSHLRRHKEQEATFRSLREHSTLDTKRMELLSAKGASSWLTTLPLKEHGFLLSRRDFRDALALRYDWQRESVPATCVCGTAFSADHAMMCSFGGFPTIRHNELRDFLGSLLTQVCHNVAL